MTVAGNGDVGRGDARTELQDVVGVIVVVAFVDLQLAIALIVDEGIAAAVALLVVLRSSGCALAVEGVGTGRTVETIATRSTSLFQLDQLLLAQAAAIGEEDLLYTVVGVVQFAIELDLVTSGAITDIDITGTICRDREIDSGDTSVKLEYVRNYDIQKVAVIYF